MIIRRKFYIFLYVNYIHGHLSCQEKYLQFIQNFYARILSFVYFFRVFCIFCPYVVDIRCANSPILVTNLRLWRQILGKKSPFLSINNRRMSFLQKHSACIYSSFLYAVFSAFMNFFHCVPAAPPIAFFDNLYYNVSKPIKEETTWNYPRCVSSTTSP